MNIGSTDTCELLDTARRELKRTRHSMIGGPEGVKIQRNQRKKEKSAKIWKIKVKNSQKSQNLEKK